MKYFIRSVKYLFYFVFLFFILTLILYRISGTAEYTSYSDMFKENAAVSIGLFMLAVAAIYPAVGFGKKSLTIKGTYAENEKRIKEIMQDFGYILATDTDEKAVFRSKSRLTRFFRMWEDALTITKTGDAPVMEGLRKDVIRYGNGLVFRLTDKAE